MNKTVLIITLLLSFFSIAKAQQLLTVEEAINIALNNNYDIKVARNDADIARINNTLGNAGILPTFAITGTDNYSLYNTKQKYSTGDELISNNLRTNSFSAGVALNWTLFDGGKMFVTKNKLNEIQALGEIQFKDKVLQTTYNVIIAYFDVVRQKQILNSFNEVIAYNQERVKILQISYDAGLLPKTTLLQAKIDLNVNQENSINQQTIIVSTKRTLNLLLMRDANADFDVVDSIQNKYTPDAKDLFQKINSNNTTVLSFEKQVNIAKFNLKEYKTLRFPKINISAGYNFLYSDYTSGTILSNRSYGPVLGFSVSIPIFQGGNVLRQISVANVQLKSTEFNFESVKNQANSQLQNALTAFENQLKLIELEKNNKSLVRENLDISMERLRLGQTTSLEVKQAQESFVDSQTRFINLNYTLKVAETRLKLLISGL